MYSNTKAYKTSRMQVKSQAASSSQEACSNFERNPFPLSLCSGDVSEVRLLFTVLPALGWGQKTPLLITENLSSGWGSTSAWGPACTVPKQGRKQKIAASYTDRWHQSDGKRKDIWVIPITVQTNAKHTLSRTKCIGWAHTSDGSESRLLVSNLIFFNLVPSFLYCLKDC